MNKKIAAIVLVLVLVTSFAFGDKIGEVISTDIVTYIDGIEIPSFNFNSRTGIYVKDLEKAGFKVLWDSEKRRVDIISETISKVPESIGKVTYSDEIVINIPKELIENELFITDKKGNMIRNISIDKNINNIKLTKTYYLSLGDEFIINFIDGDNIIKRNFTVSSDITEQSFKNIYDLHDTKSVIIPANEAKGFSFPYRLSYITRGDAGSNLTIKDTRHELYLTASNHGTDKSFEDMMSKSIDRSSFAADISRQTDYNGFIMYAIFPRLRDAGGIYTHSLDRQTIFGTQKWLDSFDRGNLYRIDKQFKAMSVDAIEYLDKLSANIDKPMLVGFSASSDFVSRMNYLHPDLAKAVIINDAPTMPFTEHNGVKLKYPLGMADISEITGKEFNKEKFIDTPQFWTTGSHDDNDGTYFNDGWGTYTLDYRHSERNAEGEDYRKAFGDNIIERREYIRELLKEKGFNNIQFHTYDVGHNIVDETLKDINKFLNMVIN